MSDNEIIIGLTAIVALGVGAQWFARRTGIPSVLVLLPAGLVAGGVTGLVEPDELFGDLLYPAVTLLVSLLLFHSGLELRLRELPSEVRGTVARLVSVGAVLTFAGAWLAAGLVLDVPTEMAALTGAILVVSGPTVVGPLLRVVRPQHHIKALLTWESTALDPIGATLGVVVLNLVLASNRSGMHPLFQMFGRLGLGLAVGLVAALLLILVMSRFLVTDDMEAAVALLFAVAAFAVAELALSEAGLFATVTLGVVTANQRLIPTARIAGFGETLEVLIIGTLFIVLGALVDIHALWDHIWAIVAIVALLVLVVRPITTIVCLRGASLTGRERALVGWMDPRGIVAASTAAQFSGTLAGTGYATDFLLPVVFGVIVGTGVVYGLTAAPLARLLEVRRPPPTRIGLVGDDGWLVALGRCLEQVGASTVLVTPSPPDGRSSSPNADGSLAAISLHDSAERIGDELEDASLAQALVSGSPSGVVMLTEARIIELVGRRHVLRVPDEAPTLLLPRLPGPWATSPFGGGVTRSDILRRLENGQSVEILPRPPPPDALVLASVGEDGAVDFLLTREPGQPVAALVGLTARRSDLYDRSVVDDAELPPDEPGPGRGVRA